MHPSECGISFGRLQRRHQRRRSRRADGAARAYPPDTAQRRGSGRSAGRRALDISVKSEVLAMTRDEILAAFDRIRLWQQGDRRAVHKPLLVLLALGRLLRGEAPLVEFAGTCTEVTYK
jgi:hypothetical protein